MVYKIIVRLLLSLIATHYLPAEHFDIKSEYLTEAYKHPNLVLVKKTPRFDGSFKHDFLTGLLVRNLYGGKSGGFFYLEGCPNW